MFIYENLPIAKNHYAANWGDLNMHSKFAYSMLIPLWIAELKTPGHPGYVQRDPEKLALIYQTEGLNDEYLYKKAVKWINEQPEESIDFSAIMKNWFVFRGTGLEDSVKSFLDFFKPEILTSKVWERISGEGMIWIGGAILPPVEKKEIATWVVKNVYNHAPDYLMKGLLADKFMRYLLSFLKTYPEDYPKVTEEFQILDKHGDRLSENEIRIRVPMLLEDVRVPGFVVRRNDKGEEQQCGYCLLSRKGYYPQTDSPVIRMNDGNEHHCVEKRESLHLFADEICGGVTRGQANRIIFMQSDGKMVVTYYDLTKLVEEGSD